jgi:hypothetical protein
VITPKVSCFLLSSPWGHSVLWLALILFLIQPLAYNHAKAQWENLGDAHFYAQAATHWAEHGEQRWFEIYPIALKKNCGIDMGFSAPAHHGLAALLVKCGLAGPKAVLLISSWSIGLWASVLFMCGTHIWKLPALGWAMGLSMGLSPSSWEFATSGGSDAFGLLSFNLAVLSFYFLLHEHRLKYWALGLFFAALSALARPQGQILLLASVGLMMVPLQISKLKGFCLWILALALTKILQNLALGDKSLVFPYAFSFLVGTTPWPGHALFREFYSDGFGLKQVWMHQDLWPEKLALGWQVLKQYWDSWLPTGLIFCWGLGFKKTRTLSFGLLSILGALLFLSASGHLVPRYWTFMSSSALLIAWIWMKPFFYEWKTKAWIWVLPFFILGYLSWQHSPWLVTPQARELHTCKLPPKISQRILNIDWLTTDRPAQVIDSFQKPILLLPNQVEALQKIDREVHPVPAVLLSPQITHGEQQNWLTEKLKLPELGWSLIVEEQGWELFGRLKAPAASEQP